MTDYLQELIRLVSPPAVGAGTMADWETIEREIEQEIPLDPVEISLHYGSGQFVDREFALSIYNVFHPLYPSLVRYRRFVAEADIRADRRDGFHIEYDQPFPIGVFEYGLEEGCSNIFWDMKGPMEQWPLWLPTPSSRLQHFAMPLTEFLVKAFGGELEVSEFPKPFVDLRFVPFEEAPER
jgi:hypothetical protein